ncbi:MAG: enoyl-CoA hydratase/carnithine racemase [Candidatus Azotimanducaceae bacterium]|jgi:enoyl-CoA hydratase/carnithine racemase
MMETLNITRSQGIEFVEMDRPDALNAFSSLLMDELTEAFMSANSDDSVKVLVLTGAGRAFSAGADLQEMGQMERTPRYSLQDLLFAIIDFEKPFLVAINGVGAGIGTTICGLADFVFMSEKARLRCPFSALGLTAEAASTYTFPALMGRQAASWFLLSSEWMSAEACVESGLALECLAHEELIPRVMNRAEVLAALPSESLKKTKSLMVSHHKDAMKAAIKAENLGLAELAGGPANREALSAFREKREPLFK